MAAHSREESKIACNCGKSTFSLADDGIFFFVLAEPWHDIHGLIVGCEMRGGVGAAINKFWPTKIGRVEAKNVPKLNKYRAESSTGRGGGMAL